MVRRPKHKRSGLLDAECSGDVEKTAEVRVETKDNALKGVLSTLLSEERGRCVRSFDRECSSHRGRRCSGTRDGCTQLRASWLITYLGACYILWQSSWHFTDNDTATHLKATSPSRPTAMATPGLCCGLAACTLVHRVRLRRSQDHLCLPMSPCHSRTTRQTVPGQGGRNGLAC